MSSKATVKSTRHALTFVTSEPEILIVQPTMIQEKAKVSLRKLVTGDSFRTKLTSIFIGPLAYQPPQQIPAAMIVSIKPQIRSFLSRGSRASLANLAVLLGERPRQLSLLAQSFQITPHPGDKDIPLSTNRAGLLESLITTGQFSQLSKATLDGYTAVVPTRTGYPALQVRLRLKKKCLSTRESFTCS